MEVLVCLFEKQFTNNVIKYIVDRQIFCINYFFTQGIKGYFHKN